MKKTFLALVILVISATTQAQNESIHLKLRNASFREFQLSVPGVISKNSLKFGTSSFCVKQEQQIYFNFGGKDYLLLTAVSANGKRQVHNLPRLIKIRKKELGL